jgi:hypothetical protein
MEHQQLDLVFATLDDEALERVRDDLYARVHDVHDRPGSYEREKAIRVYLAVVVELALRGIEVTTGEPRPTLPF